MAQLSCCYITVLPQDAETSMLKYLGYKRSNKASVKSVVP